MEWTAEEQEFAKACQREMQLPEAGLMSAIMPPLPEITTGGGTDVGDVSFNTPTGLFCRHCDDAARRRAAYLLPVTAWPAA